MFDFIIFDSLLKSNSYNYTFFEKDYSINPWLWQKLKAFYLIISSFNWSILLNILFEKSYTNFKTDADAITSKNKLLDNSKLFLEVGTNCSDNSKIIIPERGLFQNILITRHNRNRENIFRHVSFYRTINSSKYRNVSFRC